ncbi:OsmC family protein [Exilibacterium tricleocarpae]|nr:OsmC family protein [Exilibacterium tricleocarpae]
MKIELKNILNYQFEVSNLLGKTLRLDAQKEIGGFEEGFRPMELVLAGVAGCSAFGVVSALQEMDTEFSNLAINIEGKRQSEPPAIFTEIHLHFVLYGKLSKDTFYTTVEDILNNSCSAIAQIENSTDVNFSCEVKTG